jgi:hypothetical protein
VYHHSSSRRAAELERLIDRLVTLVEELRDAGGPPKVFPT